MHTEPICSVYVIWVRSCEMYVVRPRVLLWMNTLCWTAVLSLFHNGVLRDAHFCGCNVTPAGHFGMVISVVHTMINPINYYVQQSAFVHPLVGVFVFAPCPCSYCKLGCLWRVQSCNSLLFLLRTRTDMLLYCDPFTEYSNKLTLAMSTCAMNS